MEDMITIHIKCSNQEVYSIRRSVGSKVVEFKDSLAQISKGHIPANKHHKLIYKGEILDDDRTLRSYGVDECHVIYMEVADDPLCPWIETTLPSSDRPTGGMPDMCQLAISLMLQTLITRPDIVDHIILQNPKLRSIFDSNRSLRDEMLDPDLVEWVTSPRMIQQIMASLPLPELNQQSPLDIL